MGQYLAIGLSTSVSVSKKELEAVACSREDLEKRAKAELGFAPENYEVAEEEGYWVWQLKAELLKEELIPLLQVLYPALYPNPERLSDSQEALAELAKQEPDQWLNWAKEKPFESFQEDGYAMPDRLYMPFDRRVQLFYGQIMLSMEGKIVMEAYGRQFRFLQQCMAHRFDSFSLAKSLRIYLTG